MEIPEKSSFSNPNIHCPYCWTELSGVEKFSKYYFYKYHVYEKMIVLPIENPDDYFNLNWFGGVNSLISALNGDQKKMQIGVVCPCCGRQYTLLVHPYERNIWEKTRLDNLFRNLEKKCDLSTDSSIIDQYPFFFKWKSDWITFILSLWTLLLINGTLLFFISYFIVTDLKANIQFIIDILSLTIIQAVFIVILKRHSLILNRFAESDALPYLIHQNYQKSPDFEIFQRLIHNGLDFVKRFRKVLIFYMVLAIAAFITNVILKFGLSQIISWYLSNNLSFTFILALFTFFLYFFFIGFTVAYFVLMSTIALTIFTRSIPIKITPLEKDYGIKLYQDFLFYVIILSTIISIIIPLCINLVSVNLTITGIASSTSKYSSLLTSIQNGNFLYALVIAISLFAIPALLIRVSSNNISSRKTEMMNETGEKITSLKQIENPQIKELISLSILCKEYEQIEKLSEYPINKTLLLLTAGVIYLVPIIVTLLF